MNARVNTERVVRTPARKRRREGRESSGEGEEEGPRPNKTKNSKQDSNHGDVTEGNGSGDGPAESVEREREGLPGWGDIQPVESTLGVPESSNDGVGGAGRRELGERRSEPKPGTSSGREMLEN